MKLQLEHQKALQEQERKLLEQQQLQQQQLFAAKQQQEQKGKNQNKKGKSKASTPAPPATNKGAKHVPVGLPNPNQSSSAGPMSSIMASASKTLREASKQPGQQIKITR